ncbi:MAG: hypothetical protein QM756_17330 [Polyangiaceae bacterium]
MPDAPLVSWGLSLIAFALVGFFAWAVGATTPNATPEARKRRRSFAALGGVAWLALSGAVAASGALMRFDFKPPPLMLLMATMLLLAFGLGFSRIGAELSRLPLAVLVGWQAFRLPLELVMHHAASIDLMPSVMSYSGRNFDIVSGGTALLLSVALLRVQVPSAVVLAWQLLSCALLLNIIVVAVAATPLFAAFGEQQLNTWVCHFPYVWLPAVMVGSAILGHVVVARRLWALRRPQSDGLPQRA